MSLVASCKAFLKISLELHRVRIPWRARSASLQGGSGDGDLSGVQGAQPPVEGQVNKAPPLWSWMPFCFACPKEAANVPHYWYFQVRKSHREWISYCLTTHLQRIYMLIVTSPISTLQLPLNSDKFSLCSCAIRRLLTRDIDIAYLSVRLSVTFRYWMKTA